MSAVKRYCQFLKLRLDNPGVFLVPCYDIDIVWHTHQVSPHLYQQHTETLFGSVFHHDDSVNDRSEGSKLNNATDLDISTFLQDFPQSNRNMTIFSKLRV